MPGVLREQKGFGTAELSKEEQQSGGGMGRWELMSHSSVSGRGGRWERDCREKEWMGHGSEGEVDMGLWLGALVYGSGGQQGHL